MAPRPDPIQQPAVYGAETPQAKQPTGWEHGTIHQQTGSLKSVLNAQPTLNTPPNKAIPNRGTRARPLYMLSTRDPPQNKGHMQTESEGLEKNISRKWKPKESRSLNTHIG